MNSGCPTKIGSPDALLHFAASPGSIRPTLNSGRLASGHCAISTRLKRLSNRPCGAEGCRSGLATHKIASHLPKLMRLVESANYTGHGPLGGSYFEITISTRRFFCRPVGSSLPSGFAFGATGLAGPKPSVVIVVFNRSLETSHSFTDAARCSERRAL